MPATDQPSRAEAFLIRLARRIHANGGTAYEVETQVCAVAARLGLRVECFTLPTMLAISVKRADGSTVDHLLRVTPADVDLDKTCATADLVNGLFAGMSLPMAEAALDALETATPPWGHAAFVVACSLVSVSVGALIGGGIGEVACAAIGGIVTGLLYLALVHQRRQVSLIPAIIGFAVSLLTVAIAPHLGVDSLFMAMLAGVIVLLPGLPIVVGLAELAMQQLISGTARLAGAGLYVVFIGFGLVAGRQLGLRFLPASAEVLPQRLPEWTIWPAVILLALSLMPILQIRRREWPWVAVGAALAYLGSRLGGLWLGTAGGAFCGALAAGFAAHIYQGLRGRPHVVMQLPGVFVLIPGNVGLFAMQAMLDKETTTGIDLLFSMTFTCISLVLGILFSNALAAPGGPLLTKYLRKLHLPELR